MRTLSLVCRAIRYPFSRPRTLQKLGVALAVGALALTAVSCRLLGTQFGNQDYSRWDLISVVFGDPKSTRWTPDGSAIYFAAKGYLGESPTYAVSSDGSELNNLEYVVWPHVSPDGSRMVHSTCQGKDNWGLDIETAKPDGSGLRRVYRLRSSTRGDPADEGIQSGPVWSPNGETLAFVIGEASSEHRSPIYNILTMGADGSDLTRVSVRTPSQEECCRRWLHSLAWSPDGSRLAFLNEVPFVVNIDGTGLREAAPGIEESYRDGDRISWSSDGTKLLLVLSENWYVVEADGGDYEYLGEGMRAAWSPDGSRIAFIKDHDTTTQLPEPLLQTMAPDGSAVQVLVERHRYGELRAANPVNR